MKREWRGDRLPAAILRNRHNWREVKKEYAQERKLQTFLHMGTWKDWQEEPPPVWDTETEPNPPPVWEVYDEIETATLAAMVRFDYTKPITETLDKMLTEDSELIGLDLPDVVEWIAEVIPTHLRPIVETCYWEQAPLPNNLASEIAGELWQIEELLAKKWRKQIQKARTVNSITRKRKVKQ
jgi:hypothetical protein